MNEHSAEFAAEVQAARAAWDQGDREPLIDLIIRKDLGVLNALEPHLGCAMCKGPLAEGRCPPCQGSEHPDG